MRPPGPGGITLELSQLFGGISTNQPKLPLALLFAFAVLFARGRSANLLSIGAVDFGIIVDSTVILVEGVYRNLTAGTLADRPMEERVVRAAGEVERSLFFSTVIMVQVWARPCATTCPIAPAILR